MSQVHNFISVVREFAIKCHLCCVSASRRFNGGGHSHIQGRTASGDTSGGEKNSQPGLRCGESSGFRSNARVCKFHAANHSVNARVVSPRGFTAASTLPITHPESVAESFLHIGDVVVRVAQVFDSCHLLPGPFGEECSSDA